MRFAASIFFGTIRRRLCARCFPQDAPAPGTQLLELGCGPGFYACRLSEELPQLQTTGVDLSRSLIERATRARKLHLTNCHFQHADAHSLPYATGSVDAVVVSRLFLIVPEKEGIVREIFRVLKPARPVLHRGAYLRVSHAAAAGVDVDAVAADDQPGRQVPRAAAGGRDDAAGL